MGDLDQSSKGNEETRNVSLRAPSSEPSLHPRRDSNEDANETVTRKRPRLGNLTEPSAVTMSPASETTVLPEESLPRIDHEDLTGTPDRDFQTAPGTPKQHSDAELKNQHNLQSSTTPSRITINIREPSSSATVDSQISPSTDMQTLSGEIPELMLQNRLSEPLMENGHRRNSTKSDSPDSSSSVEIEEVTVAENTDLDLVQDIMVNGMDEDTIVNDVLDKFPYADRDGYQSAANLYLHHVEGNRDVDQESLAKLTIWLMEQCHYFETREFLWARFYYEERFFWETIGKIFSKLLLRQYGEFWVLTKPHANVCSEECFGLSGARSDTLHQVLELFFRAQIRVTNLLVQVDSYMINANHASVNGVEMRPLSWRHLFAINKLFVEVRNPDEQDYLPSVLQDRYGLQIDRIRTSVELEFINLGGIQSLTNFASTIVNHFPKEEKKFGICLAYAVELAGALSRSLPEHLVKWGNSIHQSQRSMALHLSDLFEIVSKQLEKSIDKQQDPLNSESRKLLVEGLTLVLHAAIMLDATLADKFMRQFLNRTTPLTSQHTDVVPLIWKIKLMKRYISKGRMDLRIQGIDIMQHSLIIFFQAHRNDDHQRESLRVEHVSELLEFVADVLLEEKITEFLVGVDSHPQLIMRGYNAVGFLAVTNKFDNRQADLVWKSVVTSQDPRVVDAILFMLEQLTRQLTNFDEDVYFCKKLLESSLPATSSRACSFYTTFLEVLRNEYKSLPVDYHINKDHYESSILPLRLCLCLMQKFSPTSSQGLSATGLFADTLNTLSHLSALATPAVRKDLYGKCMESLKSNMDSCREEIDGAPAYIHAMLGMIKDSPDDLNYLAVEVKVLPTLMDEFCKYVSRSRSPTQGPDDDRLSQSLEPRLDLILKVVMLDNQTVKEERTKLFWDHLVGSAALNHTARDIGWRILATFVSVSKGESAFLERCYVDFLSPTELKPEFFTPFFFIFVINITKYKIVFESEGPLVVPPDGDALDIPGIELLWRAILTSDRNVGEESAMEFLASVYLDSHWSQKITSGSLRATQVALVNNCLIELKKAHRQLRSPHDVDIAAGDTDDIVQRRSSQTELTFLRTLSILSKVLINIRKIRTSRSTSPMDAQSTNEKPAFRGKEVKVRCSFYKSGAGSGIIQRDIYIGEDDNALQLHRRIVRIASELDMASYKVIWSGRILSLLLRPREALKDMKLTNITSFIVKEGQGTHDHHAVKVTPSKHGRTAFEEQITSNFQEFYALMDADDAISEAMFDFFSNFPRFESIKTLVQSRTAQLNQIFPSGQMYKVQYSFQCLTEVLQDKTEGNELGDDFVLHGVHLIESFLIEGGEDNLTHPMQSKDLVLASAAIAGLFDFLTNREVNAVVSPFLQPQALVNKVCAILSSSFDYHEHRQLVLDSYEFLLKACRASPEAWQTFSQLDESSDKVNTMHCRLLLGPQPMPPPVRLAVRNMIKTCIERFVPLDHLTKHDLVNFFWRSISPLILKTQMQSYQCVEVFEIAEILLDTENFPHLALSQESLVQYFRDWSKLLAEHKHEEIVGQDNPDPVIRGFSTILRLCGRALPRKMIGLTAQKLVNQVWSKFLFPRKSLPFGNQLHRQQVLPVLESATRQSMLDLITTLAFSTQDLLGDLLRLADQPKLGEHFNSQRWSIDRSIILRAPSGFVGMRNLSNTCYMNSLMTQLFMNPGFRAFVLRCRTLNAASTAKLVSETQSLFARMQNSYTRAADATDFTCRIKTPLEESIDVKEQMDVDEFMNTLFLRWEEQMLTTESKEELRSFYHGKTVQQIKSRECEHVSEREDTFLAIQCDVQGKTTLEESLQASTEGDFMQGDNKYKCEPCGKLVDAVKRTCLKEIPDHLILQLKRFDYELGFGGGRRTKINDLFEFPMSIDMNKYKFDFVSDQNLPVEQDMFDLVGVIVHKGAAEHGHYVSYIRARPILADQPPLWLQFDDADVTVWEPRDVAEACFGGMPTNKDSQGQYSYGPKQWNAYMLFYQRHSTIDVKTWPSPPNTVNPQHVVVPDELERTVEDENFSILQQYCLFDEAHRNFVLTLLNKLAKSTNLEEQHKKDILSVALEYICSVWARTKDLPRFEDAIDILKYICSRDDVCCFLVLVWLASGHHLRLVLTQCGQTKVRQHVRSLIVSCVEAVRDNAELYGADVSKERPNFKGEGASAVITTLARMAPQDLAKNGRAWEEYFGLLVDIAKLGAQECWILLDEGILLVCIELFMYHWNPQLTHAYARINDLYRKRPNPPPPNNLIWLVALLFHRIDWNAEADYMSSEQRLRAFDPVSGQVPLLSEEYALLSEYNSKDFVLVWLADLFEKWETQKEKEFNDFAPGQIIACLMRSEDVMAKTVSHTLQSNIEQYETVHRDPYMRATCYVVQFSRSKEIIKDMTIFMAKTTKKINPQAESEGHNKELCLKFFQALYRVYFDDLNPGIREPVFFWRIYLQYIDVWAPYLLSFEKMYKIGVETSRLLQESIFKDIAHVEDLSEKEVGLEKRRATAIRKLFSGCTARAQDMIQNGDPSQRAMGPIMGVMKSCVDYLSLLADGSNVFLTELRDAYDQDLVDQYEGYRHTFESLATFSPDDDMHGVGDLGNTGTEWEDTELGDIEASELTDLEISDDELAG
ncbi:Ubiquitin carboxyl-terminal hydrolase-like domain [Venturia nashicola]|uniref:Ubiquitin carboxyl-terminal hydrolase-like domain n=1 Tax=Venturia nashicola TaxID=86259 RepID=A0A4Z1NUG0_9PEZI|nr:Ubiquitin carboxyl-terminal hydrolase-like domain [Venturia nashicola]TLD20924.1 Ubiquitin carboxyl-terminal hydrolase-like domain [Venturia nashicola]